MKMYSTFTPEQEAEWWEHAEAGDLHAYLQRRGPIDTEANIKAAMAADRGITIGERRAPRSPATPPPPDAEYEGRSEYLKHLAEVFGE